MTRPTTSPLAVMAHMPSETPRLVPMLMVSKLVQSTLLLPMI